MFQATWMAYPAELLSTLGFHGSQGALITVPAANFLGIHVIGEGTSPADFQVLAGFSRMIFDQHPSPLSPHVYWWDETDVRQLTELDADGKLSFPVPQELQDIFEANVK